MQTTGRQALELEQALWGFAEAWSRFQREGGNVPDPQLLARAGELQVAGYPHLHASMNKLRLLDGMLQRAAVAAADWEPEAGVSLEEEIGRRALASLQAQLADEVHAVLAAVRDPAGELRARA